MALGERIYVTIDTPIEDTIEHFRERVDYNEMHTAFIAEVHIWQESRGVWFVKKFYACMKMDAFEMSEDTRIKVKTDNKKLTNHGLGGLSYYNSAKIDVVSSRVSDKRIAADARAYMSSSKFVKPYARALNDWAYTRLMAKA